jgi:hypothetical protein
MMKGAISLVRNVVPVALVIAATGSAALAVLASASILLAAESPRLEQHAGPGAGPANPETEEAWRTYVRQVRQRHDAAAGDTTSFFALDAYGVEGWRAAATDGHVPAYELDRAQPGAAEIRVPDGAIHHWTGAIFVPQLSVPDALARVRKLAGQEAPYYDDVLESRLLDADDDRARVFMQIQRSKIVTVTYNTEHEIEYRPIGPQRAAVRSVATRIAQLEHAGTPRQRELPPGEDSGYLWRLNAYWRYGAIETGVLIECESVSLSRSVPLLLRPFLSGVVDGLARESLERTLAGLRRALTAKPQHP